MLYELLAEYRDVLILVGYVVAIPGTAGVYWGLLVLMGLVIGE